MTDVDLAVVAGLTPVQQRTLAALRRDPSAEPIDSSAVSELRTDALEALDGLADRLGVAELVVNKHAIASVLACETNHLLPDDFTWTPARARGQVSHKAIQLLLHWRGEPTPTDVVDDALARLADEEHGLGDYVAGLDAAEEAELRSQAVDRVTKFVECFPPLDRRSHPVTEALAQFPAVGALRLRAKVDLVLGRPSGAEARKVLVDLKSGQIVTRHRDDLRFYALVMTLRDEVPPRKLASFSLDAGAAVIEDVTPTVLRSALHRTLEAIERMVELRFEGRPAQVTAGPTCRWCALLDDCPTGRGA